MKDTFNSIGHRLAALLMFYVTYRIVTWLNMKPEIEFILIGLSVGIIVADLSWYYLFERNKN